MRIEEVTENIVDAVGGKKGVLILGGGLVALVALLALKNNGGGSEVVNVTSYASYPDVDRNADVIISTLQNSIDYQTEQMNDSLDVQTGVLVDAGNQFYQNLHYDISDMSNYVGSRFDETHDLVSDGFATQQGLIQNMHVDMMQGLDDINTNMAGYADQVTKDLVGVIEYEHDKTRGTLGDKINEHMQLSDNMYSSLNTGLNSVSDAVRNIETDVRIYEKQEPASVNVSGAPKQEPTNTGTKKPAYSSNPVSKVQTGKGGIL